MIGRENDLHRFAASQVGGGYSVMRNAGRALGYGRRLGVSWMRRGVPVNDAMEVRT